MKFSIQPPPGESAFDQWRDAMKAVCRLPMGIPTEFRKKAWLSLADHYLFQLKINWDKTVRFVFNERSNPDDEQLGEQIVKDLHRTGCSNFSGEENEEDRAILKRLLLAYARWNKRVGYCQGFNVIAALLLNVMDRREDEALKVMIYLIDSVLPESYFANNLRALSVDMAVFRDLLRVTYPRLSRHLDKLQLAGQDVRTGACYEPPLPNVFTMQWFLTLFATCLPITTVLRVWDSILLEGSEILLRTALTIWGRLSKRIMVASSADEFYCLMGELTSSIMQGSILEGDAMIKSIYALGEFPFPQLNELREKYTYNIRPFTPEAAAAPNGGGSGSGSGTSGGSQSKSKGSTLRSLLHIKYSDEDDLDDDDITAMACMPGGVSGSSDISVLGPGVYGEGRGGGGAGGAGGQRGSEPPAMERMTTDIQSLKLQYERLKQRQQQAHIIIAAASAKKARPAGKQHRRLEPGKTTPPPLLVANIESPTAMNHLFVGKAGAHGNGSSGDGASSSSKNRLVTDGPRISGPGQWRRQGSGDGRLSKQLQAVAKAQAVSKSRRMRTGISASASQTRADDGSEDGDGGSGRGGAHTDSRVMTPARSSDSMSHVGVVGGKGSNEQVGDALSVVETQTITNEDSTNAQCNPAKSLQAVSSTETMVPLCEDAEDKSKGSISPERNPLSPGGAVSSLGESSCGGHYHSDAPEVSDEQVIRDSISEEKGEEEDLVNHLVVLEKNETSSNLSCESVFAQENIDVEIKDDCNQKRSLDKQCVFPPVEKSQTSGCLDYESDLNTPGQIDPSPCNTVTRSQVHSAEDATSERLVGPLVSDRDGTKIDICVADEIMVLDSLQINRCKSSKDPTDSHLEVSNEDHAAGRSFRDSRVGLKSSTKDDSESDCVSRANSLLSKQDEEKLLKCFTNNAIENMAKVSLSPTLNEDSGVDSSPASSPMGMENTQLNYVPNTMGFLDEEMILRVESETVEGCEDFSQETESKRERDKHLQNIRVTMTVESSGATAFEAHSTYDESSEKNTLNTLNANETQKDSPVANVASEIKGHSHKQEKAGPTSCDEHTSFIERIDTSADQTIASNHQSTEHVALSHTQCASADQKAVENNSVGRHAASSESQAVPTDQTPIPLSVDHKTALPDQHSIPSVAQQTSQSCGQAQDADHCTDTTSDTRVQSSPPQPERSVSVCSTDSISVLLEAVTKSSPVREQGYVRATSVIETVPVAETVDVDLSQFSYNKSLSKETISEDEDCTTGRADEKPAVQREKSRNSKQEKGAANDSGTGIQSSSSTLGNNDLGRRLSCNPLTTNLSPIGSIPLPPPPTTRRFSQPFNPFPVKHFNTSRMKAGLKLGLYTPSTLEQLRGLKPRTTSS